MEKYLLIATQKDETFDDLHYYRLYKDYESAKKGFEKWRQDFIDESLEELNEEEKQDYLEAVEDNEMFDLYGDYEMSCVCPNNEWSLYVVKVQEEE